MQMSQSLTKAVSSERDPGTLGGVVRNVYDFEGSGRDLSLSLFDHINSEEVPAREYFEETGHRFVVGASRLPYDFDIKGVYLDKKGQNVGRPSLELSVLDFHALGRRLREDFGKLVVIQGKSVYSESGEGIARTFTSERRLGDRKTKRSTVNLLPLYDDEHNRELAVRLVDSVYEGNTFIEDEYLERQVGEITGAVAPDQRLELRQQQELRQLMVNEQVLALQTTLNHSQIQSLNILRMSTREIEEKLLKEDEEFARTVYPVIRKRAISRIHISS